MVRNSPFVVTALVASVASSAPAQDILAAARSGDTARVAALLAEDPANANTSDRRRSTPLHFAAGAGAIEVIDLLLAASAQLEARDVDGDTPLQWAAHAGELRSLQHLLAQGADVGARNRRSKTALHYAGPRGFPTIVEALLARGADPDAQDHEGNTPLHLAALASQRKVVALLLAGGADTELREDYGRTPLLLTAREGGDVTMMRALLDGGADIDAVDRFGDTALTLCAWRGYSRAVDLLLDRRAGLPSSPERRRRLLEHAVERGLDRLFAVLVEAAVELDFANDVGGTLLHSAAVGGSTAIADALLERGFAADAVDRYGWTPLHHAADAGHEGLAARLLAAGADPNRRSLGGKSAYDLAVERRRRSVQRLLEEAGVDRSPAAFPELEGPWLGQTEPGREPALFGADIVSDCRFKHGSITFSPDGTEAFWSSSLPVPGTGYTRSRILTAALRDGRWTAPRPSAFAGDLRHDSDVPFFSPDGRRLYFLSRRPGPGGARRGEKIWFVDRRDGEWSEPELLVDGPNSLELHWQFAVAGNGTIYFGSGAPGGLGMGDVWCSRLVDGRYAPPENLGAAVNSEFDEHSPFVAPDESYLIFDRMGLPGDRGRSGLHISFRRPDGTWTPALEMGERINAPAPAICAIVSADRRFLFFNSRRLGHTDIFWVDAGIIDELRAQAQ